MIVQQNSYRGSISTIIYFQTLCQKKARVKITQPVESLSKIDVVGSMNQIITATFEDGILKPDEPLDLSPHSKVRLVIEPIEPAPEEVRLAWEELERLCVESPIDSGGTRLTRDQLHERR